MAFTASLDDDDDAAGNDRDDSGIEAVGVSHAGPPRFRPQHNGRLGRRLCSTLFHVHYHHNYKFTIYIHASLVKFFEL